MPQWPDTRLPIRLQLAFGHDAGVAVPEDGWTDVTGDLMPDQITIKRGRSGENSRTQPTTAAPQLDNTTGDYTPDDPRSRHWPDIVQGVPCRISVAATNALCLPEGDEAHAATAATAAFNTADLDVRLEVWMPTWHPGSPVLLAARDTGTDWIWRLMLGPGGTLALIWTPTGAIDDWIGAESTAPVPLGALSGRLIVRAVLDVNDETGGHTIRFFLGPTLDGPWATLGLPIPGTGTTVLPELDAPFIIGALPTTGRQTGGARVYRARLHRGIDGPALTAPNFTDLETGTATWTDATGQNWELRGGAAIDQDWQTRITGSVDEWAPTWPWGDLSSGDEPGEARVNLTVSGMLRRLEQGAEPLQSALRRRIVAFDPVAYWPLEEGKDATRAHSPIPGVPPMSAHGIEWANSAPILGSDSLPRVTDASWSMAARVPAAPAGTWRVELAYHLNDFPDTNGAMLAIGTNGDPFTQFYVSVGNGVVHLLAFESDGSSDILMTLNASSSDFAASANRLDLRCTQSGSTVTIGLGWTVIGGTHWSGSTTFTGTAGRVTEILPNRGTNFANQLSLGHLSVWSDIAAADDAYGHADHGYTGERAGHRVQRLCEEEGLPITLVGNPDTTASMGYQRIATLLDLLREAADTDDGVLAERRDAHGLFFKTRDALCNQPLTTVLDAANSEIDNPFAPVLDDQRLRNDITVSRPEGSSARATDPDSIARRGRYTDSVTANVASDHQLPGHAYWRLNLGTWPGMRYGSITTNLGIGIHRLPGWLTLDTGDRLQAIGLPPQHPDRTLDLLAEGYTEHLAPTAWTVEATCSPAGPRNTGHWAGEGAAIPFGINGPARYDTTASQLATETDLTGPGPFTLLVNTTAGPLWTTDPTEIDNPDLAPIQLDIAGVIVEVDTIEGDATPQTFTTRRVNDLAKTVPAGTPVALAEPVRYAL